MKTIPVEIITPEKLILKDNIESIVVPSYEGELGILPGHTHLLAQILPGEIRLTKSGETKYLAVSGGFVEVHPYKVEIFTETAELAEEVDAERAKQSFDKAKSRLKGNIDTAQAKMLMQQALVRLRVVDRIRKKQRKN